MSMPIEFIMEGTPRSAQRHGGRRRDVSLSRWREQVAQEATLRYGLAPTSADVIVAITCFHTRSVTALADVDNMAKPVLDALKGVVWVDDKQVRDLVTRRRYLTSDISVVGPSDLLLERLDKPGPFTHIWVDYATRWEVTHGNPYSHQR